MSTPRGASIETTRLILRPMRGEDATALHMLFGDPSFMEAFEEPPFSMDQTVRWVQRNLDHQREHGFGLFAIVLRESGQVIGDCGFEVIALQGAPAIELGYDVVRRMWGRGIATEAAQAVATFGFDALGLHRIVSLVRAGNDRSERVARKIGMVPVGPLELGGIRYGVLTLERTPRPS